MSDWNRVEADRTAIIAARPAEYDEATRRNLSELFDLVRTTGRPAPDLSPGYWPTFRITWDLEGSKNLEIEVFGTRYEVYRFFDGRTDIWYEKHDAGAMFSDAFVDELPKPC